MKKLLSLFLVIALSLCLVSPALSAQSVSPAPPAWCPAEEYTVFSGSKAYEGETWEKILSLREFAQAGNTQPVSGTDTVLFNRLRDLERISGDPGVYFELGILDVKFALNAAAKGEKVGGTTDFEMAAYYAQDSQQEYLCRLWNARMVLASRDLSGGLEGKGLPFFVGAIEPLLSYPDFTLESVYTSVLTPAISAQSLAAARETLFVTLDGKVVHPRAVRYDFGLDTTTAHSRNNRTMVPLARLAGLMGADVSYDAATQGITVKRADTVITMTLGSRQAARNGEPFTMDVAPYAENNRTYIPIAYIAPFFGQEVEWISKQQHVRITEDKSVVGSSNMESWALAMGALLNYANKSGQTDLFGGKSRFGTGAVGGEVSNVLETTGVDFGRKILREGWGIQDREALYATTERLANSPDETYPAWDLFRVSNLAQWGYLAGYVTYPEALELVQPAAQGIDQRFSSWQDAYENYLGGWAQWSGSSGNLYETERGKLYLELRANPEVNILLDDTLFQTGVRPLPSSALSEIK